ncbi:MAG TPA: tRNA pseudouridine(38-40) synthase TruA [Nitrospira sp.]|nr:tRNA pseudouridine(38-40) synthase TruA [Nitrospira sp.]
MSTVKLTLEYDGTRYAGWQRQPDQRTIQEAIEIAIRQVTQRTVAVIGAGRTDAGVHALGQVASFRIDKEWTARAWVNALNARLPEDIVVRSADLMPDTFHARHAAKGKLYQYRILNRPHRAALDRLFVWHVYRPLAIESMQKAAACLVGTHDFSSFEGSLTDNEDPLCRLQQLCVTRQDDLILIGVYADRFLKHMVRAIVGTLVEVGQGRRRHEEMTAILAAADRTKAGRTAPAHGLFLLRVDY